MRVEILGLVIVQIESTMNSAKGVLQVAATQSRLRHTVLAGGSGGESNPEFVRERCGATRHVPSLAAAGRSKARFS